MVWNHFLFEQEIQVVNEMANICWLWTSVSIKEFLKPAQGERYYSPGSRGSLILGEYCNTTFLKDRMIQLGVDIDQLKQQYKKFNILSINPAEKCTTCEIMY